MLKIPSKTSGAKISSLRDNLNKADNSFSRRKLGGRGFSGKGAKHGSFSGRKKGGVAGAIWKYTTKGSALGGAVRKSSFKNLSNKDLTEMSDLVYNEMKKNERPGITKYQKQKILRQARTKMSREDLKDFRKIVKTIETQTNNPKRATNLIDKKVITAKKNLAPAQKKLSSNKFVPQMHAKMTEPTVLKINRIEKKDEEDKNDNEIQEEEIKNVTTAMNLKNGPPMPIKINPQEKENNKIDDLPDLQID